MKTQKREKSVFNTLLKVLAVAIVAGLCAFIKKPTSVFAADYNHTCSDPNNCSDFSLQVYRCPEAGCNENFAKSIAAGTANSYLLDSSSRISSGDAFTSSIRFKTPMISFP